MARVAIPVTAPAFGGVVRPAQTSSDATNDHEMVNDGRTILEIENTSGSTVDVVLVTPQTVGPGIPVEDVTISIPAGETWYSGPLPKPTFNQADGKVYINVTVSTSIKFRAVSAA